MTADEIKAVEDLVNEQIKKNIPVVCEEMTVDEAKAQGAIGIFDNQVRRKGKSLYHRRFQQGNLRRTACKQHGRLKIFQNHERTVKLRGSQAYQSRHRSIKPKKEKPTKKTKRKHKTNAVLCFLFCRSAVAFKEFVDIVADA